MKNYRFLVPIVLVALFVLGVYTVGSENMKEEAQYRQYLEEARSYASQEIEIYAVQNYQDAIAMRPSLELYMEVAEFYRDNMNNRDRAAQWGEMMLEKYPKEPRPYEFQLDLYLRNEDPVAFFDLYDRMEGRHVESEAARDMYRSVEYAFYEQGDYDEMLPFSGNLAPVRRNETWGYCNTKGKKKIGTLYTAVGAFSSGMAPVTDGNGQLYYIDSDGNKVMAVDVEENIQELGVMSSSELYTVYNGKEWSYYSRVGERLMGGFLAASTYANGLAAARSQEGWRIYDTEGNVRPGGPYEEVALDEKQMAYRNGRLFVRTDGSFIMTDGDGNRIGTDTYEDVKIFYENTYAAVKSGGKWGFIDRDGNWFLEPVYEDARSFSNGYAAVQSGGLWGFINTDKEICIPCQFTQVKDFTGNGTAPVCRNQTWSVLILYKDNH